jgi:PAS domain S-box-containing protein
MKTKARTVQRLALRHLAPLSFGGAAILVVVLGIVLFAANQRSAQATRAVAHTLEVIKKIGDINSELSRAESAQRGYLLSEVEGFLVERDEALARLTGAVNGVKALTADSQQQQGRVSWLERLMTERVGIMQEGVKARQAEGFAVLSARTAARVGQGTSAQVYDLTGTMEREELRLLALRRMNERDSDANLIIALMVATLIGLLVLGYISFVTQAKGRAAAERKLKDMAESLPGAVYQCRSHPGSVARRHFEFLSGSVTDLLGVDREALLQDPERFRTSVHEDDRLALDAAVLKAASAPGPSRHDFRIRNARGQIRWIRDSISIRKQDDGSLLWNGYWADITDQKQREQADQSAKMEGLRVTAAIRDIGVRHDAEKQVALSEEKYRTLLDGVQDHAIFMLDPAGQVVSWNAGAQRIKGYSAEEIIGQNFSSFFPAEDIERGRPDEVLRATESNGRHEEQSMRIRKDGSRFLANVTLTALRDAAGALRGFSEISRDLTESKESGAKYRGLLEAAPDAMVVVDQGGEIVLLNVQAETQFGYHRDELVGQRVTAIIPEGFAERLIADGTRTAAEALAQQIGTGIELSGRRKDGTEFPIELMLSPLQSAEGILVTAAIRDISVRKAAERVLAQMGGRYRGLLEAAPDAMVVVNQAGGIVLLNVQAEKTFGYRRDELVGQQVKNIIPEGFAERLIADGTRSAAEALAQQIGTGIELSGRRRDGSDFPIEIMLSPLESDEGILVTAAIRDISVRKEAERNLAQMGGRYRGLLEAAPDAMVVVNQAGEIVLLNVQAEKTFGYRRDELVGQRVKNIIPEGFAERLIADGTRSAAEALAQQIGTGIELSGRRRDGSAFPIEIMLSPLQSDEGILVTAAIRDISVRKDAERQKEAAEASNRAKSVFLATMSHEIRTPMNGLLGMLELLGLTNLDASQRATLDVVRESGRSLQRIIDDILDFSKIEAGKLEVRPEPASVEKAVEGVFSLYSGNAISKGILLRYSVDPQISSSLLFDPLRLRQILNNLVSNAIKFTEKGEIEIGATLTARTDGEERVRISVKDTGIGVSVENQTRLFQPFAQASGTGSPRSGGTGLGLTICMRLAEMMGGSVEMTSELGTGTTVLLDLSLPIAAAQPLDEPDPLTTGALLRPRRPPPDSIQAEIEGTLVLIVDDHPTNRLLIVRQVNTLGYAAESAVDGLDALAKWESGRFGVVITDCNMPKMDGYEFARQVRAIEARNKSPRVPIIACTAIALGGEAETCLAAGMDDYLAKPVDLKNLARKLDQWRPIPRPLSALDRSILAAISGGDARLELDILADFRRVNDEDVALLSRAVMSVDLPGVTAGSHRIKGASRSVGAVALAAVCERIEHAARVTDWIAIEANMGAFRRETARLNAYCEGAR